MRWLGGLAGLAALAGCAYPYTPPALPPVTTGNPAVAASALVPAPLRPVTILVSIDGFRPDYLRRGDTPALDRLAAQGVEAAMRPSFPTMTFPNHYTLVTGLRPDRHGMVDNTMEDPARPGARFTIRDAGQVRDPFWWDGAEPIWVAAERAGLPTATMFWPGSEAPIRGVRPAIWMPYDASITSRQRVEFVLDWLRRPQGRPGLVTLYLDVVDKRAHNQGFASAEETQAIREVDETVRHLRDGLTALGRPANLVVVSDHGMAPVPRGQEIDPATIVAGADTRVDAAGPLLHIWAGSAAQTRLSRSVPGRKAHATCWSRASLPARFHYGRHPRVPPFLCMADPGWRFGQDGPLAYVKGEHGYDPDDPAMRALFIAAGPAFTPRREFPAFDNVDVYPLLRRLIGLPPAAGLDGDAARFDPVLKER